MKTFGLVFGGIFLFGLGAFAFHLLGPEKEAPVVVTGPQTGPESSAEPRGDGDTGRGGDMDGGILDRAREENGKLRLENTSLRKKVEELEAQVESLAKRAEAAPSGLGSRTPPSRAPAAPAETPAPAGSGQLDPGKCGLEGLVLDAEDNPRADVRVHIYGMGGSGSSIGKTDGTGAFRFWNLSPDHYSVTAHSPGSSGHGPSKWLKISAGEVKKIRFGGRNTVRVFGTVRDWTASPVKGCGIRLHGADSADREGESRSYSGETDREGRFVIHFVEPGEYSWNLSRYRDRAYGFGKTQIPALTEFELNIDLPATKISGVVVDEGTGEPVMEAHLSIDPKNEAKGEGSHTQSDVEGRFLFEGVAPGEYTIRVFKEGYGMHLGETVSVAASRPVENLRITMSKGLNCFLIFVEGEDKSEIEPPVVSVFKGGELLLRTTVKPFQKGVYSVIVPGAGTYTFRAEVPGYEPIETKDVKISQRSPGPVVFNLKKLE
ncbi:MAG: carboxypeptidase regulatory-like domain-containing protein [Planctomycetota bacterium]|jgi:hypothetical protein